MALQAEERRHWPLVVAIAVTLIIVIAAFATFRTMPPRTISMATGPEGGAYYEIGKRYQALLARSGVRVRLVPTSGSVDNLAMLRNRQSGVGVALLQGGTVPEGGAPEIKSLGTVFYEPLWLFNRKEFHYAGLEALRGRKVSIGTEGSGTRALSLELLKRRGYDGETMQLLGYSTQEAADKLLAGEIDALVMLASWESPVVRKLLADERVELAQFPNIDAYIALYPFLSRVTVPAGLGDLASNRPPSNVPLFAPTASLVVRSDLHSAIQYLLLNTAVQIHSGPGIFQAAGRFPAAEAIDLSLSPDALQYYRSGRPFLQNYLPFWMASLAARLLVLLIPILGLLYPVVRFLPLIYAWAVRRKLSRLYGELRFLEDAIPAEREKGDSHAMIERLDQLEKQAAALRIPAAQTNLLYTLRNHISQVRRRLALDHGAGIPSEA